MKKKVIISVLIVIVTVAVFYLVYFLVNKSIENSQTNTANITEEDETNQDLQYLIAVSPIEDDFPKEINEVQRESYISGEKVTYPIKNYKEFLIECLRLDWEKTSDDVEDTYYYIIDIYGDKNFYIKIYKKFFQDEEGNVKGYAEVYDDNGNSQRFIVPVELYNNTHYYLNENIDLYYSGLEVPAEDKCYNAQEKIMQGLSDEDKETVENNIRMVHSNLENLLKDKGLNDSTSQTWDIEMSDGEVSYEDLLGTKIVQYNGKLKQSYDIFVSTINMLQDSQGKEALQKTADLYNEAMNEHSVLKLYNTYKIIHDYDLFVINYPPFWNLYEGQQYPGVNTYFGSVEELN